MKTFIYVLKCPITKDIRYVGKSNNPKERLRRHLEDDRNKGTYKWNWLQKLKSQDLIPDLEIIAKVPIEDWHSWEKFYIKKYIEQGCNLVNCTDGGDGLTFGNQTSFKNGHGSRSVVALNKDGSFYKKYDSILEAEKELNSRSIWHALSGKQKTSAGYIWLYEEDYNQMDEESLSELVKEKNLKLTGKTSNKGQFKKGLKPWNKGRTGYITNNPRKRPILQIDKSTYEIIAEFESISEAIKKFRTKSIDHAVRGKNKTACGYIWRFKDE